MADKVFAFANQKGGVGKTTTCVNLAASLVAQQQRVLLLDLDPQGNATMGSGVDKSEVSLSMNDLLMQDAPISEVIIRTTPAGYHLVASNSDLTVAEVALTKTGSSERRLQNMIAPILEEYDWILIDCPPALNMLTLNALTAADAVIIAMQCEYYALEGLSDLLSTVAQIQQSVNPGLKLGGILRTMFDARNRLAVDVSSQLVQHFGSILFQSVIPRNVRLAEAPSHGIPIQLYDRSSRGAAAYMAFAAEWLQRYKAFASKKVVETDLTTA